MSVQPLLRLGSVFTRHSLAVYLLPFEVILVRRVVTFTSLFWLGWQLQESIAVFVRLGRLFEDVI